jgi:hypothetical protein
MTRNPAASPDALYAFVRKHIAEEDGPEDRSGRTPLQALADQLSALGPEEPELDNYRNVAPRLIDEIPSFSDAEVSRLIKFILSVRELPTSLPSPAQRTLRRLRGAGAASRRADVMWLLHRLGRRFLPREIQREDAIKEKRPWLWFDLALASAPAVALSALPELAQHPQFLPAMLSRVVRVWRSAEHEFPAFLSKLNEQLDEQGKARVAQYLNTFEISAPPPADERIGELERVAEEISDRMSPYHQDPLAAVA